MRNAKTAPFMSLNMLTFFKKLYIYVKSIRLKTKYGNKLFNMNSPFIMPFSFGLKKHMLSNLATCVFCFLIILLNTFLHACKLLRCKFGRKYHNLYFYWLYRSLQAQTEPMQLRETSLNPWLLGIEKVFFLQTMKL